jgi:hypothetical protein
LAIGTSVSVPHVSASEAGGELRRDAADAVGAAGLVAVDRAQHDQPGAARERAVLDRFDGRHEARL